jgi:DNA (cytosine-5)-methyltransferase 1
MSSFTPTHRGRRLLDLFCGEGLAAWGYWRSGCFTEIVGVDTVNMSTRYSFDFIQADAMTLTYDFLMGFDFIHASPPCQAYSKATPAAARGNHPKLVAGTSLMLAATGLPHVIENVEGAGAELHPNMVISGRRVGLAIDRRRYFKVSGLEAAERLIYSGGDSQHVHGQFLSRDELIKAFGLADYVSERRITSLTKRGILQGIPPAMTHYIASKVLDKVML